MTTLFNKKIKDGSANFEYDLDFFKIMNQRLADGKLVYMSHLLSDESRERYNYTGGPGMFRLRPPSIAIYAGSGVSHSWLWFVEITDRLGFADVSILTENEINDGKLTGYDSLLVSGGETFAIANSLGVNGKTEIDNFIKQGGLYFGTCAGACMMMKSTTEESLGLFDLVQIKVANIVDELPKPLKATNKFSTPYGCAWVFHPVREEVLLNFGSESPFNPKGDCIAPLYGGPPMEESDDALSIAKYKNFTTRTEYLADPEIARNVLIGKTAICMKASGKGSIVLSGPHLEHPNYPKANAIIADAIFSSVKNKEIKRKKTQFKNKKTGSFLIRDIKREISNIRIVASALEYYKVSWKIGKKYYEPEKIRVYVETIWKFILYFEKLNNSTLNLNSVELEKAEKIIMLSKNAVKTIRKLKKAVDQNEDSNELAFELFNDLRPLAVDFFSIYFNCKSVTSGLGICI
jgi:glutamine amidotransferase-like uncharacterized protein